MGKEGETFDLPRNGIKALNKFDLVGAILG